MKLKKTLTAFAALAMFANSAHAIAANTQPTEVYESASAKTMVRDAFNKLRYQLTVEWDQEAPYFKQRAQEQFEQDLKELMAQGVQMKDIRAFMEETLLNSQSKAEYSALLSALEAQGASAQESAAAAARFIQDTEATGASFTGSAGPSYRKIAVVLGIIAVAVITYHLVHDDDDDDETIEEEVPEEECPDYCYYSECEYPIYQ